MTDAPKLLVKPREGPLSFAVGHGKRKAQHFKVHVPSSSAGPEPDLPSTTFSVVHLYCLWWLYPAHFPPPIWQVCRGRGGLARALARPISLLAVQEN
jgi:hypothetical protein